MNYEESQGMKIKEKMSLEEGKVCERNDKKAKLDWRRDHEETKIRENEYSSCKGGKESYKRKEN